MSRSRIIKGIQVQGSNQELEILLNAWIKAIVRFTSANKYDNPWWYNERASLSVLAGAAWTLKGWHALEEFTTQKRLRTLEPGVDSGSLRHGRCDLYIRSPTNSFAVEAKHTVQSIGARSDGITFASRAIRKAWEDSGHLSKWEAERRFAVTFIVPSIPLSEVLNEEVGAKNVCVRKVERTIKDWLTDHPNFLGVTTKITDFAFVFPQLGNPHYEQRSRYYPGVVVVFEERHRANRLKTVSEEQAS